ncbi:hypothetical protein [Mucisphaera sp.]|uniref:hypothetical protein n=1 Tax=Mucisphaera sp. TaxID=2913024 RepID=UPI003D112A03
MNKATIKRRLRKWVTILSLTAVLCLLLALVVIPASRTGSQVDSGPSVADRLTQVRSQVEAVRRDRDRLQSQTAGAVIVRERPDWSVLFEALALVQDADVVLSDLEVTTVGDGTRTGPVTSASVVIAGEAAEQSRVSDFAVRLEACGLFERVLIAEARRLSGGDPRVTFRVVGTMAAATGGQP